MNISPEIIAEAKRIVLERTVLPAKIKVGGADPVFSVYKADDHHVVTHATINVEGVIYKIGTEK